MIARLVVAAALAGSALGAAAVLADEPDSAPRAPAVATPAAAKERPMDVANPRDIELVRRDADPRGGASWAVRRFTATLESGSLVSCFELGRLDGETFGWIDGAGTFTPATAGAFDTPSECRAPVQLQTLGASTQRFTTVSLPEGGTARPLETVTFGVAAPAVGSVRLAGERALAPDANGIFLSIATGPASGPLPSVELVYRDGHRTTLNAGNRPPYRGERPLPLTDRVAAQAPDPAGGQPWALISSRGTRGGTCLSSPGRIVGTQLGILNRDLATFVPGDFGVGRSCGREPTRAYPIRMTTLVSSIGDGDPRGRIERRTQSTRLVFYGRVHPDVTSVTIRTPRDIRTLVPTSRAHAVVAVYDGLFPGGEVTATARMKDGREVTRSLYVE